MCVIWQQYQLGALIECCIIHAVVPVVGYISGKSSRKINN